MLVSGAAGIMASAFEENESEREPSKSISALLEVAEAALFEVAGAAPFEVVGGAFGPPPTGNKEKIKISLFTQYQLESIEDII